MISKTKKTTKAELKRLAKKEAKREAKRLMKDWADQVKARDNHQCIICQSTIKPNAHHLISRSIKETRYKIDNGVTLCAKHHRCDKLCSPHAGAVGFDYWFRTLLPERYYKIQSIYQELNNKLPNKIIDNGDGWL